MKTLEQLRAADALARVKALAANSDDDEFKTRYRSYVERLGPAIVMNGLGQALATESAAAPDEAAHGALYASVQAWLCRREGGVYPGMEDLLEAICTNDESFYLRAQAEALAWLEWHKKFCKARFPRAEREG